MVKVEQTVVDDGNVIITNNQRRGVYRLLINSRAMEHLLKIPDSVRPKIKQILFNLYTGEWEKWGTSITPEFVSYQEREGDRELYTLYIPELKASLIWKRVWSVDLLSRIEYPVGTYGDEPFMLKQFAPHVILSFVEMDKPPSFKFMYDDIRYEQQDGLNQNQDFWQIASYDQLDYSEEVYLLGKNVIDDLLNGIQRGLPLQMSEEQVQILQMPGPALVSGEAGSGKTIIITHWLMINHLRHTQTQSYPPPISQLFVTFSERLSNNAKKNFSTMLPKKYSNHNTVFLTYRNLIIEIAKEGGILHKFPKEKEMTFERFMKEYAKKYVPKIDPVLLWDEIRSVIKGRSTELQNFIDLPSYEQLSEQREQCKTPKNLRRIYYESAQRYQNYLQEHGFWDELDLVKACIPHLNNAKKYDKIACDEVQDLAPIEIRLLIELIKNGDISNLFLTGDVAQVINPSGFQWDQVKRYLGEVSSGRSIPDVQYLEKNYRSCEEIVELVNSVLSVRRTLLNDRVSRLHQRPLVKSRFLPMILTGKKSEMLMTLGAIKSDPDKRLILVKTLEEKTGLLKHLGEAKNYNTLLTIEEAKGLEYDGALFWNFFIPRHPEITKNDWEKVFIPKKREQLREEIQKGWNPYGLTYEFNLLHVGLTRSRFCLFVFDDEPHQKMTLPFLGDEVESRVTRGDLSVFQTNWKTPRPSADDLFNAGQRLIERDTEQANRFFKLAAKSYSEQGFFARAAECQEIAGDYDVAADLYKIANDEENELRVLAIKHNKLGKNREAGELYIKLSNLQIKLGKKIEASSNFEKARECYHLAREFGLAADAAYQSADCLPQDKHLDRGIKFLEAVASYVEDKNLEDAIKAEERSVDEAKEAQRSGMNSIQGQYIDAWVSQRYFEIAEYEKVRDNIKEGASAANKSANLIRSFIESKEFESIPNKEKYIKNRAEALTLSIELYIKSNQIIKATDSQKELIDILRPRENVVIIRERWKTFATLYMEQQEFDQYAVTISELTKVLTERRQYRTALSDLKESIEKIQALDVTPRKPLLKLIDELIKIAKENNEWDDVADAHEILGKIYETDFKFVEAWHHFNEVGKALILAEKRTADKHFRHGINLLSKAATSVEVGKNCFFEIVLNGYAKSQELYDHALRWLKESATYFAQDFDLSVNLLESYLNKNILEEQDRFSKKLKGTTDPAMKKQLEEQLIEMWNSRGWVETCIGQVYKEYAKISGNESTKKTADKWFTTAKSSFKEAKNSLALELVEKL